MEIICGNPFKSRVAEIDENITVTVLQMNLPKLIRVLYLPTKCYDIRDN